MRSALHSHSIQDEVPVYNSLPTDIATSGTTYPAFPASISHVDPASATGYEPGEPSNPNPNAHHEHMKHDGLHLDPNLSPEGPSMGRQILPNSSPLQHQQHHDFSNESPTSARNTQHVHHTVPPHIPNSAPPGHFDMLPPPQSTHPSWQALHDYAQSHASAHGYALSINTTAKNRSRIKLACVCYGQPKNTHKLTPETRVRKNRVSYKTGCRMWIEGKKQEDGSWILRVGEPVHNHPGRAMEGWAVQRKRTWGVQGGRIGVGGVTAKEEQKRLNNINANSEQAKDETEITPAQDEANNQPQNATHSLERGGLVWKIVEQEMMRKGGPGQGRDRGVGRTVKVLEERLPGIHIFKRDVYNIRAQIKRARKAAGQEIGEGLNESENEDADVEDAELDPTNQQSSTRQQRDEQLQQQQHEIGTSSSITHDPHSRSFSQIDPTLIAQCNSALKSMPQQQHQHQHQQIEGIETEVERLRREVLELRKLLGDKTKELEEKTSENESLRVQVELANMALYNERGGMQVVGQ